MRLPTDIVSIRQKLYFVLLIFSIILLGLTSGRVGYTTHIPRGDPLNDGVDFFDPSVVELIVCAILLVLASSFFGWIIYTTKATTYTSRIWFEIAVLSVIWFLLIVGTGIATSIWPNLNFCIQFTACQVLQAMLAFAWLSWLLLSTILAISVTFALRNRAWQHHIHSWGEAWSGVPTRKSQVLPATFTGSVGEEGTAA